MATNSKPLTQKQYKRWLFFMSLGYKVFRCHQLPDRSFHINGIQFPLCARCTGILIGFVLLGPIITIFTYGNMYVSLGLILLMIIDGTLQLLTKYRFNNMLRLLTGLGFGYASFSIIVHMIVKTIQLVQ